MVKKLALVTVIVAVVVGYLSLGGERYISPDYFQQLYVSDPLRTAAFFFILYFVSTAFSLPSAATVLSLVAGMVFGLGLGTVLVSFASSFGATGACFFARFLLRGWVQRHLSSYVDRVNRGIDKDGATYLLVLRLIPVFPFWVINLAFGLTRMPLHKFYLVSQVGMFPATVVYVNAGAQLGAVDQFSVSGILTPQLLISFALLAVFPLAAKTLAAFLPRRKAYKPWSKPRRFDANLIVIGAGSAGLVSAYIAAAVKAKVYLIEKDRMGGDCLNTGCVPSKALLRAAKAAADIRHGPALGINAGEPRIDFQKVMAHVRGAIKEVEPHDSVDRYSALGVDCIGGEAQIVSPWQVDVNGRRLTARNIIIATGGRPRVPEIPGVEKVCYLTSENLWSLDELPERLLIVGGGPVGCEMAQAFARLGSRVVLVQRASRLLPRTDSQGAELLASRLSKEGVELLCSSQVSQLIATDGQQRAIVDSNSGKREIPFDRILFAAGRLANTEGFGLEKLGLEIRENGTLAVNEYLQTRYPNIYACGDVCGPYQLTHGGAHQAWYAAVNSLFGGLRKFRVDYRLMPEVVYTSPEIATVGLSEELAVAKGIKYEATYFPLSELDRAIADDATAGFVKVLTLQGKDKILGVTIVANRGGEMLAEFVTAMKHGKGLNSILSTIHPYPGYADANKMAAGQWKQNHVPRRLLVWVEKFHLWRRGA